MDNIDWERENSGQSFNCNGKLLARLRRRKGWTQEVASKEIGYAVRTIRKAESGGSCDASTIAVLAEAYATPEDRVSCLDIVCNPLDLVMQYHRAYQSLEADMIDLNKEILSEDLVMKMGEPEDPIPFAGLYKGHQGFAQCWSTFFSDVYPTRQGVLPAKAALPRK